MHLYCIFLCAVGKQIHWLWAIRVKYASRGENKWFYGQYSIELRRTKRSTAQYDRWKVKKKQPKMQWIEYDHMKKRWHWDRRYVVSSQFTSIMHFCMSHTENTHCICQHECFSINIRSKTNGKYGFFSFAGNRSLHAYQIKIFSICRKAIHCRFFNFSLHTKYY